MRSRFPFHSNAVWPPLGFVAVFAVANVLIEVGLWGISGATADHYGEISSMPEIRGIRSGILGAAAGLYAVFRLWRFHPACNLGYASWLRSTPWTPTDPLPLGPIQLVWQDAVVLAVLAALARWQAHANPAMPLIVFGLTYLFGLTLLLAFTRTWTSCLLLGFLWPATTLPVTKGPLGIGLLAVIVFATWHGHIKSLRAFPWRGGGLDRAKSLMEVEIRMPGLGDSPSIRTAGLGWPFRVLSPKMRIDSVSPITCAALSALFGWWTYCAIVGSEFPSSPGMVLLFAVMAALLRFAIYCSGLAPSFNVWGRLTSGRIVVPGFDQVFVTPLIVIALAVAGGVVIRHSGRWYPIATAGVVTMIWFALLNGGPTMKHWVLTGQHRFRPPSRLGTNKQFLRPI